MSTAQDPLRPHSHEPNPTPPSPQPDFDLHCGDGSRHRISLDQLRELPETTVGGCTVVSTGHGTSGPFVFSGVRLIDLIEAYCAGQWSQVEVIGGDGFGTRIEAEELRGVDIPRPILLAHTIDGRPMRQEQGLVRLIVPGETDDALRQIKWVGRVHVLATPNLHP